MCINYWCSDVSRKAIALNDECVGLRCTQEKIGVYEAERCSRSERQKECLSWSCVRQRANEHCFRIKGEGECLAASANDVKFAGILCPFIRFAARFRPQVGSRKLEVGGGIGCADHLRPEIGIGEDYVPGWNWHRRFRIDQPVRDCVWVGLNALRLNKFGQV